MGQAFFHQVDPGLEVSPMFFQGVVGRSFPPGVVYWMILNLYRKFQFIKKFKVTRYFVTIVRQHFQWLEVHIKIHGMSGKQCAFSAQRLEKGHFFLKHSTLTQWTPCAKIMDDVRLCLLVPTSVMHISILSSLFTTSIQPYLIT